MTSAQHAGIAFGLALILGLSGCIMRDLAKIREELDGAK